MVSILTDWYCGVLIVLVVSCSTSKKCGSMCVCTYICAGVHFSVYTYALAVLLFSGRSLE